MKNIAALLCLLSLATTSFGQSVPLLHIINHYDASLHFLIGRNPEVLPEFPADFSLFSGKEAQSRIADVGKEAYIRVEDKEGHSAFWGVELSQQKAKLHGYLAHGIAYSWHEGTITFCTPADYQAHKKCQ